MRNLRGTKGWAKFVSLAGSISQRHTDKGNGKAISLGYQGDRLGKRLGTLNDSTLNNSTLNDTRAAREPIIVVDENGLQGMVADDRPPPPSVDSRLLVHFQNGRDVFVPSRMLIRQDDGRYYLPINVEALLAEQERSHQTEHGTNDLTQEMADGEPFVIPVIEERLRVQTRSQVTGAVEIRKTVNEHTEIVDQPLLAEEVEVERVPVNRFVDAPLSVRHEGDTMIIPLLEEVLVIEKRLLLREEVHVKTVRKELHNPQEVVLRQEHVDVVRKPGFGQGDFGQGERQENA
jgi:uncharacterized protein (TIGR02271 family)